MNFVWNACYLKGLHITFVSQCIRFFSSKTCFYVLRLYEYFRLETSVIPPHCFAFLKLDKGKLFYLNPIWTYLFVVIEMRIENIKIFYVYHISKLYCFVWCYWTVLECTELYLINFSVSIFFLALETIIKSAHILLRWWNTVVVSLKYSTYYYMDDIELLLKSPLIATFSVTLFYFSDRNYGYMRAYPYTLEKRWC